MNTLSKVKSGFSDFINGIRILARGPKRSDAVGDKALAYYSRIALGQINVYGADVVRTQIIKSIEKDLKRKAKKGEEAVQQMMDNAFGTPDYMHLLQQVGLNKEHVKAIAAEALRGAEQRRLEPKRRAK